MGLKIIYGKDFDEIEDLAIKLGNNGYKINSRDDNFVLLKKRAYGNMYMHLVFIIIALIMFYPAILFNLVYFAYNFIKKSEYILITTETKDKDGKKLEFDDVDMILNSK
ncbi:hypothetical protein LJB96_02000 [Methanobrevibacter sp. OttesenSCG-928-K11]|nr:hypothetical protein [Methanobrevibacter sp. OttesenSCG-928-K11]MDL2270651.1 hypothetical protein [Methanobrevibacter sp. OttesenSCG-928-I08]